MKQFLSLYDHPSCNEPHCKPEVNSSCLSMIIRHVTNLFVTWRMILQRQELFTPSFQWGSLHDGWSYRDRNCLKPHCKPAVNSSVSRIICHVTNLTENRGYHPRDRNCLPPVFSEVSYMTDDHREAGTVGDKQFLLLYDHPSCNECTENRGLTVSVSIGSSVM
jgi:hypothetical protein